MLNFAVEEESYELGVTESEHDSYDFLLGDYPGEVGLRAQDVLRGWEGRVYFARV